MKFPNRYCHEVRITMHKKQAEMLGIPVPKGRRRRRMFPRGRGNIVFTFDTCSKLCLMKALNVPKE